MEPPLQNQIAIVTGASRGIGRAIARELAAAGAAVVVNYRAQKAAADAVVADIIANGGHALACAADVAQESAVRDMVHLTVRTFGRVDVLICNAGIIRDALIGAMSSADWDDVIATNLRGVFVCIREVLPQMMAQKSGSIVMLSSIAADHAGRGHGNYVASKGAINALTRSLAVEFAPRNIRVNTVSPGIIQTEMTTRIRSVAEDEIRREIPLRRVGEPEDVARAVRFLASREASYITGAILHVTGGFGL